MGYILILDCKNAKEKKNLRVFNQIIFICLFFLYKE